MKNKYKYITLILLIVLAVALAPRLAAQSSKPTQELRDSIFITNLQGDTLLVRSKDDVKKNIKERREKHKEKHKNSEQKHRKLVLLSEDQADEIFSSLFGTSKKLSNADSIIKKLDALPPFGIYKDNFFIAGTELTEPSTRWNSDAKFQISVRHRITNSTLPFKTYLFFTYTQKALWDVFKKSFPFRDLNYNPSIGIGRALVYKNRLLGSIALQFEHESNGKDGEDSRSWNKITFAATLLLHDRWMLESEIWIPLVDGGENKDLVKYTGWGNLSIEYTSENKKYVLGASITKRGGWNLNHNVTVSAAARIFGDSNQFLFLEFYNGYGESLLDYKQYRQRVRMGFVIKPDFMNFF